MVVLPTAATARLAAKAGLRFFGVGPELKGCFAPEAQETLQAYAADAVEPLTLHFLVRALDPLFSNYTEPPDLPENRLPLIDESQLEKKEWEMSGKPKVEAMEAGSALHRGICSEEELMPLPLLVIRLDFSGKKGLSRIRKAVSGTPLNGTVAWKSRRTRWRYFVPCDGDDACLQVEDSLGEVRFQGTSGVSPEGFRSYAGFISEAPVPLSARAAGRFQLKKTDQGRCRVLVKALPNASAERLQGMDDGESRVFVSDIFVHHYIHGR